MSKKPLPDLDKGHRFYSDEANEKMRKRIIELIEEEKQLALDNRRKYAEQQNKKNKNNKKGVLPIDGDEETT